MMKKYASASGKNIPKKSGWMMKKVRGILLAFAAICLFCIGMDSREAWSFERSAGQAQESSGKTGQLTDFPDPLNRYFSARDDDQTDPEGKFEVFFIDVGQGDASLVVCDGHAMLIDGGHGKQSDKIYSFLKEKGISHLDYIVATHPDDDHIGGLSGALNYATVNQALSPVKSDDSEAFQNFLKYLERQNIAITVPEAGEQFTLGSAVVNVLGPVLKTGEDNNNSLVLRVEYGKRSFLFTGDAEKEEEESILDADEEVKSSVLKVAHHGSASSTSQAWLDAVHPSAAIISCGAKNEYGHPSEEVLKRLKETGMQVFRTDLQGDIQVYVENGKLYCVVEKNPDADVFVPGDAIEEVPEPIALIETGDPDADSVDITRGNNADEEPGADYVVNSETDQGEPPAAGNQGAENQVHNEPEKHEMDYVVNTNTGKFHFPSCRSVKQMKDSNKWYVTCDRQELLDQGYEPCGNCHP